MFDRKVRAKAEGEKISGKHALMPIIINNSNYLALFFKMRPNNLIKVFKCAVNLSSLNLVGQIINNHI